MSTVWETRYRVLRQQVEQLANELRNTQAPVALEEHAVRLLTFAITLLGQHQVNKRGRCRFCRWSRRTWRFWHLRPHCIVCRDLEFALGQNVDVVWWRLLTSTGTKCSLVEVQAWMTERER